MAPQQGNSGQQRPLLMVGVPLGLLALLLWVMMAPNSSTPAGNAEAVLPAPTFTATQQPPPAVPPLQRQQDNSQPATQPPTPPPPPPPPAPPFKDPHSAEG